MGGFLPPVAFVITANATQAMATFKGINTQLKIMDAQAKKTGVAMAAMSKSIAMATAAAKALAVVTVGFAAYGVKEIMNLQVSYNRLGQTMSAVGVSTEENRTRAADLAQSYEKLGFDAGGAADALSILLQSTKDLDQSQKLLNISADLARARTMDLATAARLVARAQGGNTRIFSMFGIQLDKNKDKATATKEAFEKLSQVIGGQATAYTQTLQGQLAVLGLQIEGVAESIGAAILPYLQKFVGALIDAGKWVSKYKGLLNTLAVVISTVVIVALVNLTKKLALATAAFVVANAGILAVVAAILAGAAAFVFFWNKSKGFREVMINIGKLGLEVAESLVMGFQLVANILFVVMRAAANTLIAWGKLTGDTEKQTAGKNVLNWIDSANLSIKNFGESIDKAQKKLDGFKDTKIDLSKFKLPSLKIGDFGNWGSTDSPANAISEDIKKALDRAAQHIADFNAKIKSDFERAAKSWADVINRNFTAEIEDKLIRNLDDLIYQAQDAVNEYQAASNAYNASLARLTKTQEAYNAAVATGDETIIAAAESAMQSAEDIASAIVDSMNGMLDKIQQIQDAMIDKIVDLKRQIADLERERTKVLADAQKERIELEKSYNEDVAKIRKQYDKDVARAQDAAAKRSAEIVKQSVDQLRNVFKSATYKSLGDIYSGITYEGRYMKGGTAQRIIANLGLQAGKAKTLANNAAALSAAGFSQTFIEEVIALGPDMGNSLATTILTSTPESIAQMKAYWEQLQAVSGHGVDAVAKKLNSGITLATEELTQQLADVQTELNATLKELDSELTDSLTEAFNEYSKALDAINIATAETIAQIDAQIDALMETIRQLMAALAALSGLQAPGVIGSAPNIIGAATSDEAAALAAAAAAAAAFADAEAAAAEAAAAAAAAEAALLELESGSNPELDALLAELERMNAEIAGRANAGSISAWRAGESKDLVITNNIYGNVSGQDVADATAWSIRTSGDVQYRIPLAQRGAKVDI
jgi:hypothetical protein